MNLIEIADKRDQKIKVLENYLNTFKEEQRKMTDVENSTFVRLKNEVEELNKQIDEIRKADKAEQNEINIKKNKINMNTNFSLRKALNEAVSAHFSDETLNFVQRINGERNAFSIQVETRANIEADTSDATGGYAVSKDYWNILEPLMANIAVTQMGAQMLTGLKGDVVVPTYSGTAAYWKGESTAAADGAGTFGQVIMSPHKLTAMYVVSKQFLTQDTVSAEQMLRNQVINAIASKLDATILGNHIHSTDSPDGFFTTGWTLAVNSGASYEKIVTLETTVNNSNGLKGNLGYIIHPTLKGTLKSTQKFTNAGLGILEGSELNGYKCVDTSNIASTLSTAIGLTGGTQKGIVFGNWSDYVIAQFGNLDISVNPYIYDAEGLIRVTVTGFFDAKALRKESFSIGALI